MELYEVKRLDETSSTNDIAMVWAKNGANHGSTVIAKTQIAGRGRLGKSWISTPEKGLYCSIVIRPNVDVADLSKITLVSGVAIADALEDICKPLILQLKWPNDIYHQERKLGGILTELSVGKGKSAKDCFLIVGIGININEQSTDFSRELSDSATSLRIIFGKSIIIEDVLKAVHQYVLSYVDQFETKGFKDILLKWKRRDMLFGKKIEVVGSDRKVITGVSQGINKNGLLFVKDTKGLLHEVLSGDLRLAI